MTSIRPLWTVHKSASFGDQHYRESIQECIDSIGNAMAIEGIDAATRQRVLSHLGVSYGPPLPPPESELPDALDVATEVMGVRPWFEPGCELCDTDSHRCPGCGTPLAHGTPTCSACQAL